MSVSDADCDEVGDRILTFYWNRDLSIVVHPRRTLCEWAKVLRRRSDQNPNEEMLS